MTGDRQPYGGWSEDEIENLVERVTKKVIENFYAEVGRSVVKRVIVWACIAAAGLAAYFKVTGKP